MHPAFRLEGLEYNCSSLLIKVQISGRDNVYHCFIMIRRIKIVYCHAEKHSQHSHFAVTRPPLEMKIQTHRVTFADDVSKSEISDPPPSDVFQDRPVVPPDADLEAIRADKFYSRMVRASLITAVVLGCLGSLFVALGFVLVNVSEKNSD